MFENKYPYTDFHELNLDYILSKVYELDQKFNTTLGETITEYIEEHFNDFMVNAIYDADTETITLRKEIVVSDATHTYDAGTSTMSIE